MSRATKEQWLILGRALWERAGGKCEDCGLRIPLHMVRYENVHHQKKRSQGGEMTLTDCMFVCGPMSYYGKVDNSCHTYREMHGCRGRYDVQDNIQ